MRRQTGWARLLRCPLLIALGAIGACESNPVTAPEPAREIAHAPHCVAPPFLGGDTAIGRGSAITLSGHGGGRPALAPVAPVGNIHILVILAEFADVPHRIEPARFEQHLFGSGTTLRDYYATLSSGRLNVSGDVFGWVTLPRPLSGYSQSNGGIGTYPVNGQKMAEDAVSRVVQAGVNLADYDADGDQVVDALLVIHSGQGYEWAASSTNTPFVEPDAINSHKWVTIESDLGGGALVEDYFTCPELQLVRASQYPAWTDSIATVGVYCHEFGHVLGLPDYYDTITFANRLGVWDIMDFGTWNRDVSVVEHSVPGALPAGLSAWSRMFLQWEDPLAITPPAGESTTQAITLGSASLGATALQLRPNPDGVDWTTNSPGSGEYFLAEVRTRTGYDAGLPAEGLLIYHVDESSASNRESDAAFPGGGLLVLVPQDADFQPSTALRDPWPGTQTTFDPSSNPSSNLFNGGASGVTLAGIAPAGPASVSALADVSNLAPTPPVPFGRPTPWNPGADGDLEIVLALGSPPGPSVVRIYDLNGRPVRTLDSGSEFLEPGRVALWDGTSDGGTPAPSGIYPFRVEGAAAGTGRLLLTR